MRYLLAVCLFTIFLVWDGFENESRFLDVGVNAVSRLLTIVGIHI